VLLLFYFIPYIILTMGKSVAIIGAGISGLTAGIYLRKAGFKVTILEKHTIAGGLCTYWERKGMRIDGCIHWMTGTKPTSLTYLRWKEVGALHNQKEIIYLPTWGVVDFHGTKVPFYCDLDKAEKAWINISKDDTKMIKKFFKMVRKIASVDLPIEDPIRYMSLKTKLKFVKDIIRTFPYYTKGMKISCEEYAAKFKHPAIRNAIVNIQPGEGNLYSMMYCYATVACGNGGIPTGGSKTVIDNMVDKFKSIRGKILVDSEVTKIEVEGKNVSGLRLYNGELVKADYYLACCDSCYTMINLLDNKYQHKKIMQRYLDPVTHPAPSCVFINYAVDASIEIPVPYIFNVPSFKIANKTINHLNIRNYNYDNTQIRNGKSVLQVLIDQDSNDYEWWVKLYKRKNEYLSFKEKIAQIVLELIVKQVPEYKENIFLLDVATPITFNRYTNASRGSFMSFLFNKKKGVIMTKGKLKGLNNFLLSGQYVQTPGGLPLALASGKYSATYIKKMAKVRG